MMTIGVRPPNPIDGFDHSNLGTGSNSSDNDQDELMDDAGEMEEVDGEEDMDGEGDDDDNDEEEEDGGDEEDDSLEQSRETNTAGESNQVNGGPTSHPHPTLIRTSASPQQVSAPFQSPRVRFEVRPEALTASSYDIVPTMAAPQATSINAITATPDMRFWFSGGADGYIRKYDGVQSINGKTLLTVAQRHPFVDSVVKAGVLMSYWDNEEPPAKGRSNEQMLSPVYSLAVHSQALWVLSGLDSGAINLYSVRHSEGHRITSLQKHKSAVSVLTMARDEQSVLSGSWDKNIHDWDLNTGQVKRSFEDNGSQISAIEVRPASTLPVPEESGEVISKDKTFTNGTSFTNGINGFGPDEPIQADGNEDAPGSPSNDSLFGGGSDANSLFGETTADGAPSGGHFGDEDDEFSRAMMASDNQHEDAHGDLTMIEGNSTVSGSRLNGFSNNAASTVPATEAQQVNGTENSEVRTNGASHPESATQSIPVVPETQDAIATSETTFVAASIDGTLRVWDRRQPNPVARMQPRTGVPPWCTAACWSPDGNFIYAGRRNGTVEEFSLHKGLKTPERTLKFPQGSNAVTAMRSMPNGRHLLW
jgi:transcriptional activator SPT8